MDSRKVNLQLDSLGLLTRPTSKKKFLSKKYLILTLKKYLFWKNRSHDTLTWPTATQNRDFSTQKSSYTKHPTPQPKKINK